MSSTKQAALEEIRQIANREQLTAAEIQSFLSKAAGPGGKTGLLMRVLFYLGGIFIFSGIVVYIAMFWDQLGSAPRIIISFGSGFACFVLALLALSKENYQKLSTPFFIIAGILQPTGIMVTFDELGSGGDARHAAIITALVMLLQNGFVFLKKQRSVLLFLSVAFGAILFATTFDLMDLDSKMNSLIIGLSLLCLSYSIDKTRHASITPFWYLSGSVLFLCSSYKFLDDANLGLLFLALTAALLYLSTFVQSRMLLFVSTVSMIAYIGDFTSKHFVDSIGWPIALIFLGFVLIGLSALALKIDKKYIRHA